jgi:predicted lipoprotein with Yx(FWY)xxD motif
MHGATPKLLAVGAVLTLALAACSNETPPPTQPAASGSGSPSAAASTTVQTADSDLGTILTDGDGMTLYMFLNDTGTTSTCTVGCATTWPALTVDGQATAAMGADDSLLGTTARDDGTTQVTYNGHPLYHYSGDSAPGDINGEGIGDIWFAVSAKGEKVTAAGGDDSGGHGYGY